MLSAQAIAVESDFIKLSPTRAVAWKQGSVVIRLIHGREGFCYLSAISGGLRARVKRSASLWNKTDGGTCRARQPFPWRRWLPWCRGRARQGRPEVTSYAWRRGDAPVKMIHKSEGFCLRADAGTGRQEQPGELTEEERDKLESYRRVGNFLVLLQSKARLSLKHAGLWQR